MHRAQGERITMPAMVRLDWLNSASGAAVWFVDPSMPFAPAPPVGVVVAAAPLSSPFWPMGRATTALT